MNRNRRLTALIVTVSVAAVVSTSAHAGTVLFVDDDAAPAGNGLSWATAYRFLQDALTDASAGGGVREIRVAQGVYRPGGISDCCVANGGMGCDDPTCEAAVCAVLPLCCVVNWDTDCAALAADLCPSECVDARMATFQLINGVMLRGGYSGPGEPDPDARDVDLYETTLSGDLIGDDGLDFLNNGENSYTVVTGSGTNRTAELDCLTITAGNANVPAKGDLAGVDGGGMWNMTGSPTVTNCRFVANSAVFGGGLYNRSGSNSQVTDCAFEGNRGTANGGGMLNYESHPLVSDCVFDANTGTEGAGMLNIRSSPMVLDSMFSNNVGSYGSGMDNFDNCHPMVMNCSFVDNLGVPDAGGLGRVGVGMQNAIGSHPTVTNCLFMGNLAGLATGEGGGMRNIIDCNPLVTNCVFIGNVARDGAGMQNVNNCNPLVTNCTFTDNQGTFGGAVEILDFSNPVLTNCLMSNNSATSAGGGVAVARDCSPEISNCTIVCNTAVSTGDGIWLSDAFGGHSTVTVCNSIVYDNDAGQIVAEGGAVAFVSYSLVEGGFAGTGNIDSNPLFVDPGCNNGDYHLSPGSPCIDAGDNTCVNISTDLDGNPRFVDDPDTPDTGNGIPPIVDMGVYEFQGTPCPWDCGNDDGDVGIVDFLALLAQWGGPGSCDFDGGGVGINDFLAVLGNWGPCP